MDIEKSNKKKHPCLWLLQTMWLFEVAAMIIYTMVVVFILKGEQLEAWIDAIPLLAALIGGQGAIAFGGPLLSDRNKIKFGGQLHE